MSVAFGNTAKNVTWLKFRTPIPQTTNKKSQYPYQQKLTTIADLYLRKKHYTAKAGRNKALRFQEILEDGQVYLQLKIPILNKKGEKKTFTV